MKTHSLSIVSVVHDVRRQLKAQGVIHLNSARLNFLPKETIRELVRLVGTPEAKAIYSELWDVAEAVKTGDIQTARVMVGLDIGLPDPRDVISHLEPAITGWKQALTEADRERALRLVETKRVDDEVVAHSETKRTAKISREHYPALVLRMPV